MSNKDYSYVDYYLGILSLIFLIIYISLVSSGRYINKNSAVWAGTSLEDKKFNGYTNMIGNLFAICICGFDGVVFANSKNIYMNRYIIKLIILMIFIGISYDVVLENNSYGIFIAALQPLVGYLQVLSIGTIVQIITKLDLKLHSRGSITSSDGPRERKDSLDFLVESPRASRRSSDDDFP
jgi:hypothetical protein